MSDIDIDVQFETHCWWHIDNDSNIIYSHFKDQLKECLVARNLPYSPSNKFKFQETWSEKVTGKMQYDAHSNLCSIEVDGNGVLILNREKEVE